jgi:hypothetical protein
MIKILFLAANPHDTPKLELQAAAEDERGDPHAVAPAALAATFRLLRGDIRCVVINACYSQPQADAIAQHVAGVVGMAEPIADRASIAFSTAFYRALAFGEALKQAFDLARNELQHRFAGSEGIPRLVARPADLSRLRLAIETPPPELVQPQTLRLDVHLAYLRRLFEQEWAAIRGVCAGRCWGKMGSG